MYSAHRVTEEFESAIAEYCGSKYAVATTSCTMGLLLACAWFKYRGFSGPICIPKFTYVGVPASILNAGFVVMFRDEDWEGEYQLEPLPIYDAARRLRSGMHRFGTMQVISLHWNKILGVQQGGVILLDDPLAVAWMKKARFDGRTPGVAPKDDVISYPNWHAYLSPEVAATALMKLANLPAYNPDLPKDEYPDLSLQEAFRSKP